MKSKMTSEQRESARRANLDPTIARVAAYYAARGQGIPSELSVLGKAAPMKKTETDDSADDEEDAATDDDAWGGDDPDSVDDSADDSEDGDGDDGDDDDDDDEKRDAAPIPQIPKKKPAASLAAWLAKGQAAGKSFSSLKAAALGLGHTSTQFLAAFREVQAGRILARQAKRANSASAGACTGGVCLSRRKAG